MYSYLLRISLRLRSLPFVFIGLLVLTPVLTNAVAASQVMSNAVTVYPVKPSDPVLASGSQTNNSSEFSLDWTQTNGIRLTTNNWSGYEIKTADDAVSMVQGIWTVPTVTCSTDDSMSYIFVGIDGISHSTIEQVGTAQDCHARTGNYYAWYEMYPVGLVRIELAVHSGDRIKGQVAYRGKNEFALTLENLTTNKSYSAIQSAAGPRRSSAEWIVEAPGMQRLTNFGSVTFTSSLATINGTTRPIGSFPDYVSADMVSREGPVRTQTFRLSQGGESFKIVWYHP